jgi:hypothetical protein
MQQSAQSVDAMLNALAADINNSGTAVLEILSAAFAAILVSYNLPATPFGAAGAGAAGYRQIAVPSTPISGTGLAAAGSGTQAAKYRLRREDGTIAGEGDVGGSGSGQEVILSNTNVANGQAVNLNSFAIRMAAPLA